MKRLTLLLLLAATPLLAGTLVQETAREFSAAADFNGDSFPDVLVLDKTSGIFRIGYGSPLSALNFADARPSGLGTVTGCAVGKLNGITSDSFAATTPTANRAHILSPQTTDYTEPHEVHAVGVGAKLLAAFDLPNGPSPTPEDDLISLATQLRAVRSNAGTWTLLSQATVSDGEVSYGNPLVPATAAAPLFGYMRGDEFHAWELNGVATTEVLTATGLPLGSAFIAATFEAPRADVIFYTPGQPTVRVRRINLGVPWTFSAETLATFSVPIEQLVAVSEPTGPKVLARFIDGSLAVFGYTAASGFTAPQPLTPTGAAGVLSGIVPMAGNRFHLLFAPAAGAASATAVTFQHGTSGWGQTAITALSAHRPLAASANVMLLASPLFRSEEVALLRRYRAADWSTGVAVGGGPFNVIAQSGTYGGAVVGIGTPAAQTLGSAAAAPGGTAVNQLHPQFSLFSFSSTLGSTVEDVSIAPDSGTYPSAVKITFSGVSGGSSVFYRLSASAPFGTWSAGSAPWVFSPTTVEYYVRTAAGQVSPTRSAHYQFSRPPAQQDQDGDGVPDFVEIARGLHPGGGPDSDGDGFSDRDEIAANTDPNDISSKPAAAASPLNTMLVDVSARLQDAGKPRPGAAVVVTDPFGNPVGVDTIGADDFAHVTALGVLPEHEFLVARTPEHFDATPTHGNARHGREMIALIPTTPIEPWSFGTTSWSWGGVNWVAGSTNWNAGLGAADGFDAGWSDSQLAPEWGSSAPDFTSAAWEIAFRAAANPGEQPFVEVTVTPMSSLTALIAGKLIGDQLAVRSDTAVDGTMLAFDATLTSTFTALRLPDAAHPSAPSFRVQALLRDLDTALGGSDAGSVALRKIANAVYARHEALSPADLATLPMPLTALATFVKTGALPVEYDLAGTALIAADIVDASNKIANAAAALGVRPSSTFTLYTRPLASPAGLTLVQDSGSATFALFGSNLGASFLAAHLPPGTPISVRAYTDLPNVAGMTSLEVISLEILALPTLGVDTPGSFAFQTTGSQVAEGVGTHTVTVMRTAGSRGAVSVSYALGGTGTVKAATSPADFTFTAGTLDFADDETSKTITIDIVQDVLLEGSEVFALTLSAPTGGAILGVVSTHTVVITDDDVLVPVAAGYAGLLNGDFAATGYGLVTLRTTASGVLSGRILVDGVTFHFSGKFGASGLFNKTFKLGSGLALVRPTLALQMQNDGSFSGVWDKANGTTFAIEGNKNATIAEGGKFTAHLRGNGASGFFLATVKTNGITILVGSLPDGTKLSASTNISITNQLSLAFGLYKSKAGHLFGPSTITGETTERVLAGDLRWTKPATSLAPIGVSDARIQLAGHVWMPPAIGVRVVPDFDATNGSTTFTLDSGDLAAPIVKSAILTTKNTFSITPKTAEKLVLFVSTSNGYFGGSFIHSDGIRRTIKGAVVQSHTGQGVIEAFFPGVTMPGIVMNIPPL